MTITGLSRFETEPCLCIDFTGPSVRNTYLCAAKKGMEVFKDDITGDKVATVQGE